MIAALKAIPWRLIGVGVAALAVGVLVWRINSWRDGYLERDAAEARAVAAEQHSVELAATFAKGAAINRQIASDLSAFRDEEAARGLELAQAIKDSKRPLIQEVTHVDPKTGATNTCRERDPVRYSELFNQATGPSYP